MKRSVIVVVVCLLLCTAVVCGAICLRKEKSAEIVGSGHDDEIRQLNQYEAQKSQLKRRIKVLESSLERNRIGRGTVSFVCIGTHKKVYNIVFSKINKRGYPGVLVLTEDSEVDTENSITSAQLSELINAGWEIAVRFSSADQDPMGSLRALLKKAEDFGIDSVHTVYFERAGYSRVYDRELMDLGIDCSIYHGEGLTSSDIVTLPVAPSEDALWQVYSWGYVSGGKGDMLTSLEDQGGSIAFEISFDSSYLVSYCTNVGINNLLSICGEHNKDKLNFVTVSGARAYIASIGNDESKATEIEIQNEIKQYRRELSDIEKQIEELRNRIGE